MTLQLKAVVGHIFINEFLVSIFTWTSDKSLECVVDHLLDYSYLWLHLKETIDFIYTSQMWWVGVSLARHISLINPIVALDSSALGF
jgi:hypothetical protein